MNRRVKLLMIVMDFYQAGAQRFAYEVDSALNRSKFDVSILSVRNLRADVHFDDYYYEKHLQLGSKIFFMQDVMKINHALDKSVRKLLLNRVSSKLLTAALKQKIQRYLQHNKEQKRNLQSFINSYDVVSWMGEYTVTFLLPYIDSSVFQNSVIHLMNAKFQNAHYYQHYPKNIHYHFTSGFDDREQLKHEFSDFSDYAHTFFPLYLKINNKTNNWKFKENKAVKKIGIFTRLDPMKPLDVFFAAFHLLLHRMPGVELHVFGAGDAVISGMQRIADNFYVGDKIFFRGHQRNIVQTAIKEGLDLVWFQGYKNRPAGYAGFDICTTGIPQLFWDFNLAEKTITENLVYPHYKKLQSFLSKSFEVLTDENVAVKLSGLQFNDVIENRNIEKHIHRLEKLFCEKAGIEVDELTNAETLYPVTEKE